MINIEHVSRVYGADDNTANETTALQDVSLDIYDGEFLSLIGPSGCGKTTLLRLLAGLDKAQAGRLLIDGVEIAGASSERGYIFQQPTLFPWATVRQNIAAGLKARGIYKKDRRRYDDLIDKYIRMIGLDGFENAWPHEISGGMVQRVAIARSLVNTPKVLLLDEPLGALDAFKRVEMQEQLRRIHDETGETMLMVTHDVDEAIFLSRRIAVMTARPGRIAEIINVNLQEPRDRGAEDFIALRETLLEKLHLVSARKEPEYSI